MTTTISAVRPVSLLTLTDAELNELHARIGDQAMERLIKAEETRTARQEAAAVQVPAPAKKPEVKEDLRLKAARILRAKGYPEVALVVEEKASAEQHREVLQAAMRDNNVPYGIRKDRIKPILEAFEFAEATPVIEEWILEIGRAADLVLPAKARRHDAFQAKAGLHRAHRIRFEGRHLAAIERMIETGNFPVETAKLLADYSQLAEVVITAEATAPRMKASAFLRGLRQVVEGAANAILDATAPKAAVVQRPGKTARDKAKKAARRGG